MNSQLQPIAKFFRQEDDFFQEFDLDTDIDWLNLERGQALWIGPLDVNGDYPPRRLYAWFKRDAAEEARKGHHFLVTIVGAYVRIRRVAVPAKKLSDWKTLVENECMLLNPRPDARDLHRAEVRSGYLRAKGIGCFFPWLADDGPLWVRRTACRRRKRLTELTEQKPQ